MVSPSTWGTHVWYSIHLIAFGYPNAPTLENKRQYHAFYNQLAFVLPCQMCRDHYTEILRSKLPLTMEHLRSRDTLFAWTVAVHNIVNVDLGKPTMPLARAGAFYNRFRDNTAPLVKYKSTEMQPSCSKETVDRMSGATDGLARTIAAQDAIALSFLLVLLIANIKVAIYTRGA